MFYINLSGKVIESKKNPLTAIRKIIGYSATGKVRLHVYTEHQPFLIDQYITQEQADKITGHFDKGIKNAVEK